MTPSLDYFIGETVEKMEESDKGTKLHFSSGGYLRTDKSLRLPKSFKGTGDFAGRSLLTVTMGETETRLIFGHIINGEPKHEISIAIDPVGYAVHDPRVGHGESYPQRVDPEELAVPEIDTEREQHGPTQEWHDKQAEREERKKKEREEAAEREALEGAVSSGEAETEETPSES